MRNVMNCGCQDDEAADVYFYFYQLEIITSITTAHFCKSAVSVEISFDPDIR